MRYWRGECYDSAGNFMDECEMSEEEMKDFYKWNKDEFLIPRTMTFDEFVKDQDFEVLNDYDPFEPSPEDYREWQMAGCGIDYDAPWIR